MCSTSRNTRITYRAPSCKLADVLEGVYPRLSLRSGSLLSTLATLDTVGGALNKAYSFRDKWRIKFRPQQLPKSRAQK
jgi:hypothetical protein